MSWDRLLVVLCVKGLPSHIQIELLKKYDTTECSVNDLSRFLGGTVNKLASKGLVKKRLAPRPTATMSSENKCSVCNSGSLKHMEYLKNTGGKCSAPQCLYCKHYWHNESQCFTNPNSLTYKGPSSLNQIKETPTAPTYEGVVNCISDSTPRITVELHQNGNNFGESKLLTDSGSTVDCVPLKFARDKVLALIKVDPSHFSLTAANGSQLAVSYVTDISVRLPGTEDFQPV